MTSFQAGVLTSVSLVIEFIVGSTKLVGFLAKIEHTSRKLFYFVIRHPQSLSKLDFQIIIKNFREKRIN